MYSHATRYTGEPTFSSTVHSTITLDETEQLRKNAFEGEGMTAGREENKE